MMNRAPWEIKDIFCGNNRVHYSDYRKTCEKISDYLKKKSSAICSTKFSNAQA